MSIRINRDGSLTDVPPHTTTGGIGDLGAYVFELDHRLDIDDPDYRCNTIQAFVMHKLGGNKLSNVENVLLDILGVIRDGRDKTLEEIESIKNRLDKIEQGTSK